MGWTYKKIVSDFRDMGSGSYPYEITSGPIINKGVVVDKQIVGRVGKTLGPIRNQRRIVAKRTLLKYITNEKGGSAVG